MGSHHSKSAKVSAKGGPDREAATVPQMTLTKAINTYRVGNRVDWDGMFMHYRFPENEIAHYRDMVDWEAVSRYQKLSKAFLLKYRNRIKWELITHNVQMDDDMFEGCIDNDRFQPGIAIKAKRISHELAIKLLQDNSAASTHDKGCILESYKVPLQTIENMTIGEFCHIWKTIARCQDLSESYIIANQSRLDWNLLSQYQKLSLPFIQAHEKFIEWNLLSYNKHLTYEVASFYRNRLSATEEVENALGRALPQICLTAPKQI